MGLNRFQNILDRRTMVRWAEFFGAQCENVNYTCKQINLTEVWKNGGNIWIITAITIVSVIMAMIIWNKFKTREV